MKRMQAYFDHASTTPIDPRVLRAMLPYFNEKYGNPSNLYEIGRQARQAIDSSLETITGIIDGGINDFIFTGSATESDNLAIAGFARANRDKGDRIIISSVEHKGIMAVCEELAKEGFEIIKLPVDKYGILESGSLEKSLNEKTILVSVTMADSETGTLQPIREIASIIRRFRGEASIIQTRRGLDNAQRGEASIAFHTDASQAAAYCEVNVRHLGVDLMTLSAHKLGGPKGVGGLYVRNGLKIKPLIYGGGQQGRLRSGTENVPGIVGFAKALELAVGGQISKSRKVRHLRDLLEKGIFNKIPKVRLNGHPTKRLPNFCNFSVLDVEGEALLLHLDEHGIMVNTGSACNSASLDPSYVLMALGNPYEFIHGSLRFTLGHSSKKSEVIHVLKRLPGIVEKLRRISPLNLKLDQKLAISDPHAFIGGKTPRFARSRGEASITPNEARP